MRTKQSINGVKINGRGALCLSRRGHLQKMLCPRATSEIETGIECGDWCPLFGEPEIEGLGVVSSDVMEVKTVSLKICEREFVVDAENFADER